MTEINKTDETKSEEKQRWRLSRRQFLIGAGLALYVYSGRGLTNIHQITWIPFIEFLSVLVMALLFGDGLWVVSRIRRQQAVPGN